MRGAPQCGGLLPLSHFHCGDGCLSLAARYQRAFWEAAPQGPPWSGPCLSLSHHILAFFFFFSPSFVLFPCLIFPCLFSTIPESHLSRRGLCLDLTVMSSFLRARIAQVWGTGSIMAAFFSFLIRSYLWVKWFSFIWSALWHIFTYLLCGLLTHGCSCEERAGV